MNFVRSLLRPPSFEEEDKTRAAALLHIILVSTLFINFVAIVGDALVAGYDLASLRENIITAVVQIGLFLLMRRGQVWLAGLVLTSFGWLVIAFATYSNTGILNPIFAAETLIIIIAGLLISEWVAVGFAAVSIVFGFWLVRAAEAGTYINSIGQIVAQHAWVNYTTIFSLTAILLFVSLRAIRDARERASRDEQALRVSEEQYRQLFENNPHPMSLVDTDKMEYLAVNDAAIITYGYSREEFLKLSARDIRLPEDQPQLMEWQERVRSEQWNYGRIAISRHRKKDGSFMLVESAAHTLKYDGRNAALIVAYDLTERIKTEEALRHSEELLSKVFESVPVAIGIVTLAEGRVINVNNYLLEITGYERGEVIGARAADFPAWVERSQLRQITQIIEKDGALHGIEFDWHTKPGQILHIIGSAMQVEINGETCILAIGLDITERKQAEQVQLEAERLGLELEKERDVQLLKDRFISTMSHEFRTPLAIILTAKESLEHYYERLSPKRREEHFRNIDEQIHYLVNLLDEILTISKARAGKMEFNPIPLDLVIFTHKLFEQIQMTDKANHRYVFASDQESHEIMADKVLLQHILVNLISNAVKYSPEGSEIRLELAIGKDDAVMRISDQGIGIPVEDQAYLFDPFFRAKNVKSSPGTGLGLTIVKECVESHGGSIACESQEGKGTTFVVRLPLQPKIISGNDSIPVASP